MRSNAQHGSGRLPSLTATLTAKPMDTLDTVDRIGRELPDFLRPQHITDTRGQATCRFVVSRSPVRVRRVA